jgi:hypothetical protein
MTSPVSWLDRPRDARRFGFSVSSRWEHSGSVGSKRRLHPVRVATTRRVTTAATRIATKTKPAAPTAHRSSASIKIEPVAAAIAAVRTKPAAPTVHRSSASTKIGPVAAAIAAIRIKPAAAIASVAVQIRPATTGAARPLAIGNRPAPQSITTRCLSSRKLMR